MIQKDSTRSWIVLAVVTCSSVLTSGSIKNLSVLLPVIREQFTSHTWVIGSCISTLPGWGYLIGMCADALVKRLGVRISFTLSACISIIGMVVCTLSSDVPTLLAGIILQGFLFVLENIGLGIIPDYFDKYYNEAVIATSFGTVFAIMVIPLPTQEFLDVYGWRGATLMMCGLSMHMIAFGAFLKDETAANTYQNRTQKNDQTDENVSQSHQKLNNTMRTNQDMIYCRIIRFVKEIFDLSLLKSLSFIAQVIVPGIVNGYTLSTWIIYTVSFALSKNMSMKQSTIIATCGGIGMGASKIVLPSLNRFLYYKSILYLSSLLMATSFALGTVFYSFSAMCIVSMVYGFGVGMHSSELYIAIKNVTQANQYINAVATYHTFYGFAAVFGATTIGYLYDWSGIFTISYIVLSVVSVITSLSLGLEHIWERAKMSQ